jgi:hypothetical protein
LGALGGAGQAWVPSATLYVGVKGVHVAKDWFIKLFHTLHTFHTFLEELRVKLIRAHVCSTAAKTSSKALKRNSSKNM